MSVVTELIIDGSGATRGAEEYERAMDRAQTAMRRGLGAMSTDIRASNDNMDAFTRNAALMVAGITSVIGVATLAVNAFKAFNKSLADMASSAKRAGLDTQVFQIRQFAAALEGIDTRDFAAGIEKMALRLNDASRNENELSRLLDANNIKFKEGNRLLIDTNKLLDIGRDLVFRARNEQDKIKIAEQLGVTKEWVPLLDKSAGAFENIAKEATALGLVIDRDTIRRAAEFEEEWRKAGAVFSVWIKAQIAGLLPNIDALIDKAKEFAEATKKEAQTKGVPIPLPLGEPELPQWLKDFAGGVYTKALELFGVTEKDVTDTTKGLSDGLSELARAAIDAGVAAGKSNANWNDLARGLARASKDASDAGERFMEINRRGFSEVGTKDDTKTAFQRQVESINRHTAAMEADAQAVGRAAGEHARLRAEFQLREALVRDGIKDTEAQNKKIAEQEEVLKRAADAAQALAQARVKSNIDFQQKTMFLSPQDVQIARQLQEVYGNDVTKALNSAEASQLRFLGTLHDLKDAAVGFGQDLARGLMRGESFMKSLTSAAENLAGKLANSGLNNLLSGNPTQMVIGAIQAAAAVALTLFSSERRKLEEAQKRAEAREDARARNESLHATLTGTPRGSVAAEIDDVFRQATKAVKEAAKNGDFEEMFSLMKEANEFTMRKAQEFVAGWQATVDQFKAGLGDDSPFNAARANIAKLADQVKSFVEDTKRLNASHVDEAVKAGQEFLLSAIGGVKPLSEVQQELDRINGTASGLKDALMALGMSADEAANAINQRATAAIDALRDKTKEGFQRRLDEASGRGVFNDVRDLMKQGQIDVSDAQALGIDVSVVEKLFTAELQKIIDDAQLTGQSFQDLITAFPQLAGLAHEFTQTIKRSAEEIQSGRESIADELFGIVNDTSTMQGQVAALDREFNKRIADEKKSGGELVTDLEELYQAKRLKIQQDFTNKAIEEQKRAFDEASNFLENSTRQISDYIAHLRSGNQSALSPANRLAAAQQAFDAQRQLALTGTAQQKRDALSSITQFHSDLIEAARAYYGAGSGFQSIFNTSTAQLQALPNQVRPEDLIIAAINAQTDFMRDSLKPAIESGNATQIGDALRPFFDTLDTNTDGKLTKDELRGVLTEGQIQTIFKTLDTDNSGAITRLETIRDNTGDTVARANVIRDNTKEVALGTGTIISHTEPLPGIRDNTSPIPEKLPGINDHTNETRASIDALSAIQVTSRDTLVSSRDLLTLLKDQLTITQAVTLTVTDPRTGGSTSFAVQNKMLDALNKIVYNTFAIAANTQASAANIFPASGSLPAVSIGYLRFGTLHSGGWIGGAGDVPITAQAGEFMIRREIAQANRAWLPAFNRSGLVPANDNAGVIDELRALRRENAAMQAQIARLTAMMGERIAGAIEDQTEQLNATARQEARRPRTPGARAA